MYGAKPTNTLLDIWTVNDEHPEWTATVSSINIVFSKTHVQQLAIFFVNIIYKLYFFTERICIFSYNLFF